jgi:type IV pilus assembly protein PilY1
MSYSIRSFLIVRTLGLLAILFLFISSRSSHALDISDTPLETALVTPPPILMFVLDNSTSMNLEFMTDAPQGLFNADCYLFPDAGYQPSPDHLLGPGHALSVADRRLWRSQWAGYNRLYYSPQWHYAPWPSTQRNIFAAADPQRPASDPVRHGHHDARMHLASPFFSVQIDSALVTISNAHYFTYYDADGNGRLDTDEQIYLVAWADVDSDGLLDVSGSLAGDQRCYYRLADDGDGLVEDNELSLVHDEAEKNRIRPCITCPEAPCRPLTDAEELQNFANWFTYYRRREFTAKAIAARSLNDLRQINAGLYAVNTAPRLAAQFIKGDSSRSDTAQADAEHARLLDALYAMQTGGGTNLRQALDQVGRYLDQNSPSPLGASPFLSAANGGGCQKACSVIISDGFWNGAFSGAGNADGDNGRPYADAWSDTLADVAMTYYEKDLGPALPDLVPVIGCDRAVHQHMNIHVVSFGPRTGTLGDAPALCGADGVGVDFAWPQPVGTAGVESDAPQNSDSSAPYHSTAPLSADLWHAALNGQGRYFDVHAPNALIETLSGVLSQLTVPACAEQAVFSSTGLSTDAEFFQVRYDPTDWSGEVCAYPLDAQERPLLDQEIWCAADQLKPTEEIWDQRRIITYGGRWAQPGGIAFRYEALAASQLADLTHGAVAEGYAKTLIDYIRGESIPEWRVRKTLLGDIVHGGPALFGHTLFVGANDGMLHALDSNTGRERFAYVPGLIFNHLQVLSDPFYADHHQYYVDGPLYVGEALVGEYQRNAYLVGGLGKGGKGYFCLLAGRRERARNSGGWEAYQWSLHVDDMNWNRSEEEISDLVRWEYPRQDSSADGMDNNGDGFVDEPGEVDPNIGYSFGQAYVVNANVDAGGFRPVVIFANGYDSDSQKAVLYILAADSGKILRIIDTGAAGDNGLSTPALIDVDLDRRVDYAYAGDLQGNLWKFDLTANDPALWGVAYGADNNGDGVIDAAAGDSPQPLFQTQGQPITGRPNVMMMHGSCAAQLTGFMVYFGTGRYLGVEDINNDDPQSLYAIWDYGDDSDDSETLGSLTSRQSGSLSSGLALYEKQIVAQTREDEVECRQVGGGSFQYGLVEDTEDGDRNTRNNSTTAKSGNPKHYAGWFLNLPVRQGSEGGSAERIIGDAVIRGGKIIVTSYVPDNTPCSAGGHSWLYILDACSGDNPMNRMDQPAMNRRFKGKISNRPVVVKDPSQPRLDRIVFNDSAGHTMLMEIEGEAWGQVYWRQDE